jgi:endonuclease/exonuclease/phosphatase family metal-dependent hydrolase
MAGDEHRHTPAISAAPPRLNDVRAVSRLLLLLIACFALASCAPWGGADPLGPGLSGDYVVEQPEFDGTLKVVSYNIAFAEEIDQAIDDLGRLEEPRGADVILLQEMDEMATAQIAQALQYNFVYYSAGVHEHHDRSFGNAILSRWPLKDAQRMVLPHANPKNGQRRIAVRALVAAGDLEVSVYSVHTETIWLSAGKRAEQVASLVDSIDEGQPYVLVGGDFNTLTDSAVVNLEQQFEAASMERASSWAGPTADLGFLGLTLDHIFVRGMTVLAAGTAQGAAASDHLPLWCVVRPLATLEPSQ